MRSVPAAARRAVVDLHREGLAGAAARAPRPPAAVGRSSSQCSGQVTLAVHHALRQRAALVRAAVEQAPNTSSAAVRKMAMAPPVGRSRCASPAAGYRPAGRSASSSACSCLSSGVASATSLTGMNCFFCARARSARDFASFERVEQAGVKRLAFRSRPPTMRLLDMVEADAAPSQWQVRSRYQPFSRYSCRKAPRIPCLLVGPDLAQELATSVLMPPLPPT